MKTIALVTHVRDRFLVEKGKYFKTMMDSVDSQLGVYGDYEVVHHVLECRDVTQYDHIRYEARSLGDYIAFVDDDDILHEGAINRSIEAIKEHPEAGVVFSKQQLINNAGYIMSTLENNRPLTYTDVVHSIQTIHHLALIKTSALPLEDIDKMQKSGARVGIEWMMKSGAALAKGAVHIPEYLYSWRVHQNSMHRHYGPEILQVEATIKEGLKNIFHNAEHGYFLSSAIPIHVKS